jgi:hypothetical protein
MPWWPKPSHLPVDAPATADWTRTATAHTATAAPDGRRVRKESGARSCALLLVARRHPGGGKCVAPRRESVPPVHALSMNAGERRCSGRAETGLAFAGAVAWAGKTSTRCETEEIPPRGTVGHAAEPACATPRIHSCGAGRECPSVRPDGRPGRAERRQRSRARWRRWELRRAGAGWAIVARLARDEQTERSTAFSPCGPCSRGPDRAPLGAVGRA